MNDHITDGPTDPDDRPEVDEDIRDSLEVDPLKEALIDITRSQSLEYLWDAETKRNENVREKRSRDDRT